MKILRIIFPSLLLALAFSSFANNSDSYRESTTPFSEESFTTSSSIYASPQPTNTDVIIKGTFGDDQATGIGLLGDLIGIDSNEGNPLIHLKDKNVVAIIHFSDLSCPTMTIWDQNQKTILLKIPFNTTMDFDEENNFVTTGNSDYTLLIAKNNNIYTPSLLSYDKESHLLAHKWDIAPDNNDWVKILAIQTHFAIRKLVKIEEQLGESNGKWAERLGWLEKAFPSIEKSYTSGNILNKPNVKKSQTARQQPSPSSQNNLNSGNLSRKVNSQASKTSKFSSRNSEIDIVLFAQSPFGLASLDRSRVSEQEFFDEMRNAFPKMTETASEYIEHYFDYGKANKIPLSYRGKDMNLAAAYFDIAMGNPLRQYIYTFTFEKKNYLKTEVIQFTNQILSDLYNGGITMEQNGNVITRFEDLGEVKGKISNNNEIIVSASEESTFDYEVRIIVTKPLQMRR